MRKAIWIDSPAHPRELASLNVNVMFVSGDQTFTGSKEATNAIPIVVSAW